MIDGAEDRFEVLEIENERIFEYLLTGDLRVSSLHTLAGHHRCLRKQLGCIFNGLGNLVIQWADGSVTLGLIAAAQLKEHGVQDPGVVVHIRTCLLGNILKLFPFPARVIDRQPLRLFIIRDLGRYIHSGTEQTHQLIVNLIYFSAKCFQIHVSFLLLVCVFPRIIS